MPPSFKTLLLVAISVVIIFLAVNAIRVQRTVNQKEYTIQVLDQYIKYYCPNAGVCSRKKALQRLRRDWPHVYRLGFQILEKEYEE